MAYLDKDGIPRVAECIQQHNDKVKSVIAGFEQVMRDVRHAEMMIDSLEISLAHDAELKQFMRECKSSLERCIICCHKHFEY